MFAKRNQMVLIYHHKYSTFFCKSDQTLTCLTNRGMRIAFFSMEGVKLRWTDSYTRNITNRVGLASLLHRSTIHMQVVIFVTNSVWWCLRWDRKQQLIFAHLLDTASGWQSLLANCIYIYIFCFYFCA